MTPVDQPNSRHAPKASIALGLFLGIVLLFHWHIRSAALPLDIAVQGFSPVAWTHKVLQPTEWALDFPSGVENYRSSIFLWVYPAVTYFLGISPESILPAVLLLEYSLLAVSLWFLASTLLPECHAPVKILLVAYAVTTTLRNCSLASYGQPFFVGQFYNVEDALRFFAIALCLRGKYFWALFVCAIAFLVHPVAALFAMAFILVTPIALRKRANGPSFSLGILTFCAISSAWMLLWIDRDALTGAGFPASTWMELTRAFNCHYYPLDEGSRHAWSLSQLVPFLSLLSLGLHFHLRRPSTELERGIRLGLSSILLLAVAGLLLSVFVSVPTIVKICAHRAADIAIVFAIAYSSSGLLTETASTSALRKTIAFTLLLAPVLNPLGLPPAFVCGLITVSSLSPQARTFSPTIPFWISFAALILGAVTGGVTLGLLGGYDLAFLSLVIFIIAWLTGFRSLTVRPPAMHYHMTAALLVLSLFSAPRIAGPNVNIEYAEDFLAAQIWARENTPPGTLFVVDPSLFYGWRDFSRRPSFGNIREWLQTGWLFNSDPTILHAGLERAESLGISFDDIRSLVEPVGCGQPRAVLRFAEAFRTLDEGKLKALFSRFNARYLVFQSNQEVAPNAVAVVYQNSSFTIARLR